MQQNLKQNLLERRFQTLQAAARSLDVADSSLLFM